ncbi:MAG TPA: CAP domain-containing protein [Edaphobacter sp.]|jgi:uncharacterized protein YkwD|nr:CAP domain-containing protein [Edaphobacter sp.]
MVEIEQISETNPERSKAHRVVSYAALIFGLMAGFCTFAVAADIPTSLPRTSMYAEQSLLLAANHERAARGIPLLHFDSVLAEAARFHAQQMAAHQDISHQFPGEPDLSRRGAQAGARFSLISENVAEAPSSSVFHELWMHSKGHRENLLDPQVNAIGIAVISRNGQFYAVEDFAATVETLSYNQQEQAVTQLLARTGLEVGPNSSTSTLAQARLTCSMDSGFPGAHKPWYIMRYNADRLDRLPAQLASRIQSGKYHQAVVGACQDTASGSFTAYNIAVLLYP